MAKAKSKGLFSLITIIIIVIGLSIFFSSNNSFLKSSTINQSSNVGGGDLDTSKLVDNNLSGYLYYSVTGDNSTDIYSFDLISKKNKLFFTDKDETNKIRYIDKFNSNGDILLLTNPDKNSIDGNIDLLSKNNPGKTTQKIIDFASPQNPIISADGKKIAYVLFSNAESDYGFKLIIADITGENKEEIVSDPSYLILYSWDPTSKKICYAKSKEGQLKTYDLNTRQESNIINLENFQIYYLSWPKENNLLLSYSTKGNNNFNQAEIYSYDINSKKTNRLTNNNSYDNYPTYDEKENLYYLSTSIDVKETNFQLKEGQINVLIADQTDPLELIKANQIIGWTK